MKTATFQQRLKRVLLVGNLRVADLARWFDKTHSTPNGWVAGSRVTGAPHDVEDIMQRLACLERAIVERRLPLPAGATRDARERLLTRLKREMLGRVKRA